MSAKSFAGGVGTSLLKAALRRLLRRVAYGLYWLSPAPSRHERTQTELAEVRNQLPVVCNAIASQNALAREWARTREQLTGELERLRAQVEQLRGQPQAAGREAAEPEQRAEPARPGAPAVLRPAEPAAFDGGLRLNLVGDGEPRADFVNVAAHPGKGIDVVADPRQLPVPPGSLAHLRCDRLTPEELARSPLAYWLSLLRPGGRLTAVVADAETVVHVEVDRSRPVASAQASVAGLGRPGPIPPTG